MKLKIILVAMLTLATAAAHSAPIYDIQVLSVYDGDTFVARVKVWLGTNVEIKIRVAGIDTPELRTKSDCEKFLAHRARKQLGRYLQQAPQITNVQYGKYAGRVVADVLLAGNRNMADLMVADGHAKKYDGGTRPSWCMNEAE